jgi:flagellin-like protein
MLAIWNYLTCSLKARLGDEKGASAVEYTLLLVMVAVVLVVFIAPISGWVNTIWTAIQTALLGVTT